MAKKLTGAALAETRVLRQQVSDSSIPNYSLAVNYDFDEPNKVDKERGVEYPDAPENRQAEQGIARHVLAQLFPANLSQWIGSTAARQGGNPGLAEALVAMKANPKARPTKKHPVARDADVANMVRALQRSGPAQKGDRKEKHEGITKPVYRERIALLRASEAKHLMAHVRGWWEFGDTYPAKYTNFKTDPTYPKEVNAILDALRNDGAGFIELVIQSAKDQMEHDSAVPDLIQTHELRVEVSV